MMTRMHTLSVLELDDLYYQLVVRGVTLQELKSLRAVQEAKLNALPLAERQKLTKQIRDRYVKTLVHASAKRMLLSER